MLAAIIVHASVSGFRAFGRSKNNYKHQQEKLVHFFWKARERRDYHMPYLGQENCVNGFGRSESERKEVFLLYCEQRSESRKNGWEITKAN